MAQDSPERERGMGNALLLCGAISLLYVLVLYAASGTAARNSPESIKKRSVAVLLVCSVAWLPPYLLTDNAGILHSVALDPGALPGSALAGLACIAALFAGPLLHSAFYGGGPRTLFGLDSPLFWRNYVVAPLCEEFTFRGCMVPLLREVGGLSAFATTFVCPAFFSAAHLHIAFDLVAHQGYPIRRAIATTVVTAVYTFVFGTVATALLLRTGSLGAPLAAHVFCNVYGLPDFGAMAAHPRGKLLLGATAGGVAAFFWAMQRLEGAFAGGGGRFGAAAGNGHGGSSYGEGLKGGG